MSTACVTSVRSCCPDRLAKAMELFDNGDHELAAMLARPILTDYSRALCRHHKTQWFRPLAGLLLKLHGLGHVRCSRRRLRRMIKLANHAMHQGISEGSTRWLVIHLTALMRRRR